MNVHYIQTSVGQLSVRIPWVNMNVNVQKATHIIQLPRTVKVGLPFLPLLPSHIPPFLSIFESTAIQIPASLIWYTDYYGVTHLFVLSGVQAILQALCTISMTCSGILGYPAYSCVFSCNARWFCQFMGHYMSHCKKDFLFKLSNQVTDFFWITWSNAFRIWTLLGCLVSCF